MAKGKILLSVPQEKIRFYAISCADSIHKLAWSINTSLNTTLSDHDGIAKANELFPVLYDDSTIHETRIAIVKNKVNNLVLVKGLEKIDYILVVKGNLADSEVSKLIANIKGLANIIALIRISPKQLKELNLVDVF
ncbi:MAG TPA: IPExxxVDY family protein [Bacteroidetes bacterium]|nr:IPExxxVDY family protein [Bacteroidota bacterium]